MRRLPQGSCEAPVVLLLLSGCGGSATGGTDQAEAGALNPELRTCAQEFAPVAKDFQEHGWVRFTPHYLVWVCPASYHKSEECRSQCIRQGRYCTPDPDGDLAKGYSGADIVQARCEP